MDKRDYAEDAIDVVLQMYNVPESMTVPITPVLDEVEKIIKAAQHRVERTAILFGFIGLGFGIVVGAWLVVVAQIAAR